MIDTLLSVTSLVHSFRAGKANERELGQVAIRYWGLALREVRANLEGAQEIVADEWNCGYLNFDLTAALLPDIARLTPLPLRVAQLQHFCNGLKQLDWWQRLAMERRTERRTSSASGSTVDPWKTTRSMARTITADAELRTFNALIDLVADSGREAFGDSDWQHLRLEILPEPFNVQSSDETSE